MRVAPADRSAVVVERACAAEHGPFSPSSSQSIERDIRRHPRRPGPQAAHLGEGVARQGDDHLLEGLLPGVYLPLYTMVTFTRIPYSSAARRACLQNRMLYCCLVAVILLALFFAFCLAYPFTL